MKKKIICSILCIGLCLIAGGCRKQIDIEKEEAIIGPETEEEALEEDVLEEEVMEEIIQKGDEEIKREYHFILPEGWSVCKTKQSVQSTLEIQGFSDDQYAAVIVLDKEHLLDTDPVTYINRYQEEAKLSYEEVEIGEIENFQTTSGPAHRVRMESKLEGKVYANYMYVVDAEEHWYITTACSYISKENDLKKDMDEFTASFYKVDYVEDQIETEEGEVSE